MSNMVVIIKTKEYIIKKAKPISNASQVYLNKKFIDSYMNLIPLNNVENIDFIEKCDDYFQITLEINCIYRKKLKLGVVGLIVICLWSLLVKIFLFLKHPIKIVNFKYM